MRTKIKTTYIDRETGEVLTRSEQKKNYLKIKCHKEVKNLEWFIQIIYIWECEKNNQIKLQL